MLDLGNSIQGNVEVRCWDTLDMTVSQRIRNRGFFSTECETPTGTLKDICGSWSQLNMRGLHCLNIQKKLVRPSVGAAKHC